jgi:glucosamine--fructose-6-phosphate aminotransferase (isomerizing)
MQFAYDQQLASIPAVVAELVASEEVPSLDKRRPIIFAGIGTSLHAARVASDWVGQLSGGQVRAHAADAHDIGSGAMPLSADDQVVVISHRGKKIYPNAALARARAAGCYTVAIVGQAAPAQDAHVTIRTCANETAGTFSVSYLASLTVLARMVAASFPVEAVAFKDALVALPQALQQTLQHEPGERWAQGFAQHAPILVSGFGPDLATAQEAALKIKEGAWIWTEAMSPEFALHGTPASFRSGMSAIVMLPELDDGGRSLRLVDVLRRLDLATVATCGQSGSGADLAFAPPPHPLLRPFLAILPFHLLTSQLAHRLGTDPDTLHGHRQPWASVMTALKL